MTSKMDRALGAMMGLAVGDALGTTIEFAARDECRVVTGMHGDGPFNLAPGEWTDDTSMALVLARSLAENRAFVPGDVAAGFQRWMREGYCSHNGRCFDVGVATANAIKEFERTGNPYSGATEENAAGNGSIMRLAPAVLFHAADEAKAVELAVLQGDLTHRAPQSRQGCAMLARILHRAIQGRSDFATLGTKGWHPAWRDVVEGRYRDKTRIQIESSGYVVHTLEAALWAVCSTRSFDEAVLLAVNLAGDADTVGAVTGQIAGAVYGQSAIPEEWLSQIAWATEIEALATELASREKGILRSH